MPPASVKLVFSLHVGCLGSQHTMARPRLRGYNSNNFDLYPSETSLGWRVIRRVSYEKGIEMCALGVWRKVYDDEYNHVGFQIGAASESSNVVDSKPSSAGIPALEMQINAGSSMSGGKSRTAGRSEDARLSRVCRQTGKALPPEDQVERIQAKVRVWPEVEAQKKDILRVWPKK